MNQAQSERLMARYEELFQMFPTSILKITRSEDNKVLVYVPELADDGTTMTRVRLWRADLDTFPIHVEEMTHGKAFRMFGMVIEPDGTNPARGVYKLSVPIMPDRKMTGVARRDGDGTTMIVLKGRISSGIHFVDRVFVHISWLVHDKIPLAIEYIDLYGRTTGSGEKISERVPNPSIADFKNM